MALQNLLYFLKCRTSCLWSFFSSFQSLSHVQLFATPWTAAHQASRPSPTPRVHPNPCPSSWWCHSTISSYVAPFSSCPQSFPASGSFQMSQLFASDGQSIGVSYFHLFNVGYFITPDTISSIVLPTNTGSWWLSQKFLLCFTHNVHKKKSYIKDAEKCKW